MKKAIHDDGFKFMYRCPDCKRYATSMNTIHPWRLYCPECHQELINPAYIDHYSEEVSHE